MKDKILLVEDDPNLGFVIKDMLQSEGYKVELCKDGATGLKTFVNGSFDLCLLDVMLPKKDGFTLAEDIRKSNHEVPIIFLTAKNMKQDVVKGFQLGGDDYITKPFSTEELKLRVGAVLKRTKKEENPEAFKDNYEIGNYKLDHKNLLLTYKNEPARSLTPKEADLLRMFAHHLDSVISREDILKRVWGDDDYFLGRSMDVFISRIRKYLKDDEHIELSIFME